MRKAVKKERVIGGKEIYKIEMWTICDKVLISSLNLNELFAPINQKITPNTVSAIRIILAKSEVD